MELVRSVAGPEEPLTLRAMSVAALSAITVVSERLGHESPAFTLEQYGHVIPGMQAEAAALVAGLVDHERAA
jgi:hypothetical protein